MVIGGSLHTFDNTGDIFLAGIALTTLVTAP